MKRRQPFWLTAKQLTRTRENTSRLIEQSDSGPSDCHQVSLMSIAIYQVSIIPDQMLRIQSTTPLRWVVVFSLSLFELV